MYYRDVFENRDVCVGKVTSQFKLDAVSPGGMVTNTVWEAITAKGVVLGCYTSKAVAIENLLKKAGVLEGRVG